MKFLKDEIQFSWLVLHLNWLILRKNLVLLKLNHWFFRLHLYLIISQAEVRLIISLFYPNVALKWALIVLSLLFCFLVDNLLLFPEKSLHDLSLKPLVFNCLVFIFCKTIKLVLVNWIWLQSLLKSILRSKFLQVRLHVFLLLELLIHLLLIQLVLA